MQIYDEYLSARRPILARPEKEFASRPLETLATQASRRTDCSSSVMILLKRSIDREYHRQLFIWY